MLPGCRAAHISGITPLFYLVVFCLGWSYAVSHCLMVSSMYISLFEVLAVFCLFPWSKRSWSGTVVSSSLCRLVQFSRMCCCVSSARPHPLHVCVHIFVVCFGFGHSCSRREQRPSLVSG